jgi:acyl-CoA synthetase (AMP-forming)/AMP-acid ligase II
MAFLQPSKFGHFRRIDQGADSVRCMPFPLYTQFNRDLWQYFIFNSDILGADWRKTDEDDVYEQVIIRKDEHPGVQGFFYTFPDEKEYHTGDLYKRHPTLPNHWMHWGRADNIIVFSNGEKLNPITIEEAVASHPQVKGAVVVGSNRFQPGLLIEVVKHPKSKEDEKLLLDAVWPLVAQVNNKTVAHGKISREFVALSNPSKPFPRSGKGSIQRAATLKLYKNDIDMLYHNASQLVLSEAPRLNVSSEYSLMESVQELFHSRLGSSELGLDTDFFSAGEPWHDRCRILWIA